jgi:hydroxymethylpyrimidine pyrophosphatase-like HAD family hydrolase
LSIGKSLQEVLLTLGILSGQDGDELVKQTEKYQLHLKTFDDSACKRTYEERQEDPEYEYQYSKAHERYWDSKHYKGYDRDYHKRKAKEEFNPRQMDNNHDHKSDCEIYDEERKRADQQHKENMEKARNFTPLKDDGSILGHPISKKDLIDYIRGHKITR